MKCAPIPQNEVERLANLSSYSILDSEQEISFDDITQLASKICETPIALVSIIDKDRQWFKSKIGIDATETPRDISFCGHAIHGENIFEVPNASKDDRFFDNPIVTDGPKVMFYAGQPLKSKEGYNLGTLCVVNNTPQKLSEFQRYCLNILGKHIVSLIELHKMNIDLKSTCKAIAEQAKKIAEYQVQSIELAKSASLGKMAGGMAHEINNPLSLISMSCLKVKVCLEKGNAKDAQEHCDKILSTVSRISQIIQSLRSIARNTENDCFQKESVGNIVEDVLSICREKMNTDRIVISKIGDFNCSVFCRKGELSQVILNLLSNSMDAISELKQKWIKIVVDANQNNVIISVIDSGIGVPSEHQEKIMDPFYTTKNVGKGTGLGLSISKSLIAEHGGQLVLDKKHPNTKFDIILPAKKN